MATFYIDTFIGVKDGTKQPPDRADGRKAGAKRSGTWGAKPAGVAWVAGDLIYVGTLRANESLRDFIANTDTALGAVTISLGTLANPTKYVNAKTLTTPDIPTSLGPRATAADDPPVTADEDLYVTLGGGGVAANVAISFESLITSVK